MSSTTSAFHHSALGSSRSQLSGTNIRLNEVLQESIRRKGWHSGSLEVIVRCEPLPEVTGSRPQLDRLFDLLLGTITGYAPSGSRHFLYVDCKEEKEDRLPEGRGQEGSQTYGIRFHTNICSDDVWQERNLAQLEEIRGLLAQYEGSLTVNRIVQTGCLYVITLPGKLP